MDRVELNNRFSHHPPPSKEIAELHEKVRDRLRVAAGFIIDNVPDCREQSIAITKLEEAVTWANAAIARNHGKIKPEFKPWKPTP